MKKTYKNYQEIKKDFGTNLCVIEYPFSWGGQFGDKKFWCAMDLDDEVFDYHTKEHLKKDLNKLGKKWVVVRWHRKLGRCSVVESSLNLKTTEDKEQW